MLGLDLLDALELRGTQSTVFAFPLVVGWLAYPVLATQVTDFDAAIGFFENRDDLRLGESTFFHSGVWSDPRNLSTLFIHCRAIGEVDRVNDPAKYDTEMDIIECFGDGRIKEWAGMHVYYHSLGNNGQERRMRNLSWPAFHLMGGPLEGKEDEVLENLSDRFRVYGLLWTEKGCYFSCDGVEIMAEESIVSKVPQFIVLSLLCENWERQRMLVDYVQVYAAEKTSK